MPRLHVRSSWKKQMVLVWASQFLSIMGFSFALPFAPYFLQEDLGVVRPAELGLWVALFSASTAVTMGWRRRLWGIAGGPVRQAHHADPREFRGGGGDVADGGGADAADADRAAPAARGADGTMTAAQAFLAGEMPHERRGLAVGGLSAAVFSGSMAGAFLGGIIAHWVGYRTAFAVSGALLLAAGLLVLCCTRETVAPAGRGPVPADAESARGCIGGICPPRSMACWR
jgi:MFS transporter, DHA1 family, multidrug resistance protein